MRLIDEILAEQRALAQRTLTRGEEIQWRSEAPHRQKVERAKSDLRETMLTAARQGKQWVRLFQIETDQVILPSTFGDYRAGTDGRFIHAGTVWTGELHARLYSLTYTSFIDYLKQQGLESYVEGDPPNHLKQWGEYNENGSLTTQHVELTPGRYFLSVKVG